MIIEWLPAILVSAVCSALFGLWAYMSKRTEFRILSKMKEMEERELRDSERIWKEFNTVRKEFREFVPRSEHDLICENSSMRIEKTFKACLSGFKDEIFTVLRKIEERINHEKN